MRLLRLLTCWLALVPAVAFAQVPQVPGSIEVCGINTGGLPCVTGGPPAIAMYVLGNIIPMLQYIFLVIAALFFFYYGLRLMLESEDSNTITETKSAYGYAVGGAVVVSLANFIVQSVGVGNPEVIDPVPITAGIGNVVLYLRLAVSIAVTGMIVYLGFRLILLQGNESEMEQQKKRFFYGLLGVAVVLLADAIIRAVIPGAANGTAGFAIEIVGIINFLLELMGAMSVLAFIVAGIMLVVSTDEALKDRAKKTIFTTIITLVIVLASYIVINLTITVASAT